MVKAQKHVLVRLFGTVFYFICCTTKISSQRSSVVPPISDAAAPPPRIHLSPGHVEIDNGFVKLTLTNPGGTITGIAYGGYDNVLEYRDPENNRGYWDIMWSTSATNGSRFDKLEGTTFHIISQTNDQVEVSFIRSWNSAFGAKALPLLVEKRYIMRRGVSGFYSYAEFQHLKGWPGLNIDEARIAFKLNGDKFRYMAISDDKQRIMPTEKDRRTGRPLAYKEAVLLTNPSNPALKGEVDDKYQYSCDNKDSHVHGWISTNPLVGFWVITPSDEFRAGGPMKRDLTSHAGSTALSIFFSDHYMGPTFGIRLADGEEWKKVFGPVFMYLNTGSGNKPSTLWEDAKKQLNIEKNKWPYDFPLSKGFAHANQRGTVVGRLLVSDKYISKYVVRPKFAYVGLAPVGDVGSWQDDAKGYQFWTQTDEKGFFVIRGVQAYFYNLYAWVPGIIGDYKLNKQVIVHPGDQIQLGNLLYYPPRNGPTLWEIGIPDRTAAEFFIPDAASGLVNKLYLNHPEKYRQYGLWDRYTDLYPEKDLVFTVGASDYKKDWFFAHVNRRTGRSEYIPTTWQILFDITNVNGSGTYTLRLALASANYAEIQVRINNPNKPRPHFTTGQIGKDNAIARHGIHGKYWLFSVDIPGSQLVNGKNTIYLRQARGSYPFIGVMYDYIRMEGPPTLNKIVEMN